MTELPEHEARRIQQYVDGQLRDPDDLVTLVQKVGERRVRASTSCTTFTRPKADGG